MSTISERELIEAEERKFRDQKLTEEETTVEGAVSGHSCAHFLLRCSPPVMCPSVLAVVGDDEGVSCVVVVVRRASGLLHPPLLQPVHRGADRYQHLVERLEQ